MIVNEKNYSVLKMGSAFYLFSYEKFVARYKNGDMQVYCDNLSGDNKKHLRMFKKVVDSERII